MEAGSIITLLKTLFGIIPLLKKYFDQPKIYLILQDDSSGMRCQGVSGSNTTENINHSDTIFDYKLEWKYKLILRNNSECTAYNITLAMPQPSTYANFFITPKIDKLKPLKAGEENVYGIRFTENFTGTKAEVGVRVKSVPSIFHQFILEYTNIKGKKKYSYFNNIKEEAQRNIFCSSYPHSLVYPQEKVLYSKKS